MAQRGVPMIMAGGSFSNLALLNAFLAKTYHSPADALLADTELGGAVDDANLHVELVRRAASRAILPSFGAVQTCGRAIGATWRIGRSSGMGATWPNSSTLPTFRWA